MLFSLKPHKFAFRLPGLQTVIIKILSQAIKKLHCVPQKVLLITRLETSQPPWPTTRCLLSQGPIQQRMSGTSDYSDKLLGACRNCGQQRGCKVDAGEIKALPPCNSCHWLIWEAWYYQPGILFSCHTICKWFSNKWFKRLTHAFWCKLTSLLG